MKKTINKILSLFNAELNGKNYMHKLRSAQNKSEEYIFMQYAHRKPVIFDVGANRGLMIERFKQMFPLAEIHAFEPYSPLYELLVQQFSSPDIFITNAAISNNSESKTLFVNRNVDTNSLLPSKQSGLSSDRQTQQTGSQPIQCIRLDDYAAEKKIDRVDILKLDIQGGELNALKGAATLLKDQRINMIFTEAYFIQQYVNQPLFYDTAQYLQLYNYNLQDIYNPYYHNGKLAWCDALFIRKSVSD